MTGTAPPRRGPTRRQLLIGGAVAGAGAAVAIGGDALARTGLGGTGLGGTGSAAAEPGTGLHGSDTVPFHGVHQAGIETVPQAHITLVALDLLPDTDAAALRRLMQILTDDAARLTQGVPALADSEPELAEVPARLTVTFGFGPELVRRADARQVPSSLAPLPAFGIDQLQEQWSDGDLLLQVAADDPVTVAHALRMLLKDTRSFAVVRWSQSGFRRARGAEPSGTTMRNLFGQIDGTVNLEPGTPDFEELVWIREGWLAGGSSLVLRRVAMDLEGWDRLDRPGREQSVGRFLSSGAPLTGVGEHDEPDFEATTAIGFPVIPEFSHIRRARSDNPGERFLRRAYNYDVAPGAGQTGPGQTGPGQTGPGQTGPGQTGAEQVSPAQISDSGLLFLAFQADVSAQFVPIQQRLAELDLLNEWTTPIGSAVFAIPPGCAEGGFIGETLLA